MDWSKVRHFKQQDFDDPTSPGSGVNMKDELILMLDAAREIAGIPFVIESGYRTKEHNAAVGGATLSAHMTGEAVDIHVKDAHARWNVMVSLLAVGFCRFEVKRNDIHVDISKDSAHPQELILFYDTFSKKLV